MLIALVNNKRSKAEPGLKGTCPGCEQPVIAKCGTQKIHHWAHEKRGSCVYLREPETEWHRSWKNYCALKKKSGNRNFFRKHNA